MSKIKYKVTMERVAMLPGPAGNVTVGDVTEFETAGNTAIVEVRLNSNLPPVLQKKIEENPAMMTILISKQVATDVEITPDLELGRG